MTYLQHLSRRINYTLISKAFVDFVYLILLCVVFVSVTTVSSEKEVESQQMVVEITYRPTTDCEKKSQNGSTLTVHYTGWYSNGTKFATSEDTEKPIFFTIGAGQVIKGWDENLMDMCVGERRRLTIPPHLGYGENGMEPLIPANATLIFEVELVGIDVKAKVKYVFKDIDLDGDGLLSRNEVQKYLLSMAAVLGEAEQEMATKESRQKMLDMIMSSHDKNKDGFLTEEEYYKDSTPPPRDEL